MSKRFRTSKLVPLELENVPKRPRLDNRSPITRGVRHVFRISKPNVNRTPLERDPIVTPIFSAEKDSFEVPESQYQPQIQHVPSNSIKSPKLRLSHTPHHSQSSVAKLSTQQRCRITTGKRNELVETPHSALCTPHNPQFHKSVPTVNRRLSMTVSPTEQMSQQLLQIHQTPMGSGGLLSQHSELQIESAYSSRADSQQEPNQSSIEKIPTVSKVLDRDFPVVQSQNEECQKITKRTLVFDVEKGDRQSPNILAATKEKKSISSKQISKKGDLPLSQRSFEENNSFLSVANFEGSQDVNDVESVQAPKTAFLGEGDKEKPLATRNCHFLSATKSSSEEVNRQQLTRVYEIKTKRNESSINRVSLSELKNKVPNRTQKDDISAHIDRNQIRTEISSPDVVYPSDSDEPIAGSNNDFTEEPQASASAIISFESDDVDDVTRKGNSDFSSSLRDKNSRSGRRRITILEKEGQGAKALSPQKNYSKTNSDVSTVPPSPVKHRETTVPEVELNENEDDENEESSEGRLPIIHIERNYLTSTRVQIGLGALSSPRSVSEDE